MVTATVVFAALLVCVFPFAGLLVGLGPSRFWEALGWVDVGHALAGDGPGPYTWWSQRGRALPPGLTPVRRRMYAHVIVRYVGGSCGDVLDRPLDPH